MENQRKSNFEKEILRTYARVGGVNEKRTGVYKEGGGEGGPKLAILLRTYFMDAPLVSKKLQENQRKNIQKEIKNNK